MRTLCAALSTLLLAGSVAQTDPPARQLDPQALADRIDHHIQAKLRETDAPPAPRADDAEFLRRVNLDIAGRIPAPNTIHAFLASNDPDKRRAEIDALLASPRYALHFASVWRSLLLAETAASAEARIFQPGFEAWLRQQLRANIGYDQLVRELLATPITADGKAPQDVLREPELPNPLAFFAVKEARPENLAATTTRLFLGIQIECAQCHNHPFARWSREQFWSQAAFFAGIERQGSDLFAPLSEATERRTAKSPDGKKEIHAAFLDDKLPAWRPGLGGRTALADWMTAADNPFFARAAVNRVWGHFFGVGLVDPVDDFHDGNPPSHPELLDELARSFVAAKFDLQVLMRAICLSQAYQRTSAQNHPSQGDARLLARMPVKALSGEQFFDSLALATGYRERAAEQGAFARARNSARERILTQFAMRGRPTDPETSIPQALALMNGRFVDDATRPGSSPTLTAVCHMPGLTTAQRLEALYLTTLSRKPTAGETARLIRLVESPGETKDERYADVFWMLLNSPEFRLNH